MIPPAVQRHVLVGTSGPVLDRLVHDAVQGGLTLSRAGAGAYRLDGPPEAINALAVEAAIGGHAAVEVEQAPSKAVSLSATMAHPRGYERTTHVAVPAGMERLIVLAIDAGLTVTGSGIGRFDVTGPSHIQMTWQADALGKPLSEVLRMWNVTAEIIAEEDEIANGVRTSTTCTEIQQRDGDGQISRTIQSTKVRGKVQLW